MIREFGIPWRPSRPLRDLDVVLVLAVALARADIRIGSAVAIRRVFAGVNRDIRRPRQEASPDPPAFASAPALIRRLVSVFAFPRCFGSSSRLTQPSWPPGRPLASDVALSRPASTDR